jgi:hypothetical protein
VEAPPAPAGSAAERVPANAGATAEAPALAGLRAAWRKFTAIGGALVHKRAADMADLAMLAVIPGAAAIALWNRSFAVQRDVLAFSLMAYAVSYLIASRSLRRVPEVGYERIFISLCAMVSGAWVFEVVTRYGWLASYRTLSQSLFDFNIRPSEPHEPFPLMYAALIIAVMFVGCRHMKVNRWFGVALVGSALTFAVWLGVGYPSYQDAWRSPQLPRTLEFIHLIPPEYAHPKSPAAPGWAFVAFWGALFTGATKLFMCSLPATLYAHHLKRKAGDGPQPPDDILARAWKALAARLAFVGRLRRNRSPGEIANGSGTDARRIALPDSIANERRS